MAYADLAHLIDRFGEDELVQLTDKSGVGMVDMAPIERALTDAAAEIDAAVRGRYVLPMSPVPDLLTRVACDLARESLYAARPTEAVKDRAKTARGVLAKIATGAMRLEASQPAAGASTAGLVEIVTGRRTSPFGG